jgi:hypothetical protein
MAFDDFYRIYPRKVARLDAEKAWKQMMARGYEPSEVIAGAEAFAKQCRKEGKEQQYIPYPASWLRAGRWMDAELTPTIVAEPVMRPAQTVDEVLAFYKSAGKPISPEIAKAKTVDDLPVFARMIPNNVTPLRRVG